MPRIIRKIQVPAYWPGVLGAHEEENSGVVWLLVKIISIVIAILLVAMLVLGEVELEDMPDIVDILDIVVVQ